MITLDASSAAHSQAFQKHLIQSIQTKGPMPFDAFVQQALYHPRFGYYMQADCPIGKQGDFITAPSHHPIFGDILAGMVKRISLEHQKPLQILEIGPGQANLPVSLLKACPDHVISQYALEEINPSWQVQQQSTLDQSLKAEDRNRVHWEPQNHKKVTSEGTGNHLKYDLDE